VRRTPAVLTLAAAAVLVAACGSTVDGSATAAPGGPSSSSSVGAGPTSAGGSSSSAPSSGSSSPSPGGDLASLLLGPGDFPPGYAVAAVDTATLAGLAGGVEGQVPGLTVTPPRCAQTNPYSDLTGAAGVTGANKAAALVVVEIVGPADAGALGRLGATLKDCSSFSASFTGPDGTPLSLQASSRALQAPPVDAGDTLGYTSTSTADVGSGTPFTTTQSQLYARVGPTLVGVALSSISGAPVDQDLLDRLFTAAVAKVAAG
jgi:hypothetical protein